MRLKRQTAQHEETSATRKAKRARRLWIAADVAAVIAVGGGLWWQWLNAVPTIHIPAPPPLPRLNAFDTFTKASGLLVDEKVIDGAGSRASLLPKGRNEVPYSETEKAAALAHNADALIALHSGFSQQYCHPSRRRFNGHFPELARFRALARLLSLEGQVRETNGDFGGAAQSRLDAMQLGIKIPRGGNLISGLVGIACESIGRRPLWALADKLTGPEARAAAERMEAINAQRVPMADNMQEEKWSTEAGLIKEFQKKNTYQFCRDFSRSLGNEATPDAKQLVYLALSSVRASKTQMVRGYGASMDAIVARARLPYKAASAVVLPSGPDDLINEILLPVYSQCAVKEADTQMEDSLLTAVLALRAYQAEQGTYPENLNALVRGGYLKSVPADPFSSTGDVPLPYRRLDNGTYLLYSIGPDGKDNNGTPIQPEVGSTTSKTWVEADMKGDFVVGVNNIRRDTVTGQKIQ